MPQQGFTRSTDLTNRRQPGVNIPKPDPGRTRVVLAIDIETASFSDTVDLADIAVASGGAVLLTITQVSPAANIAVTGYPAILELAPNVPAATTILAAGLAADGVALSFAVPLADISVAGLDATLAGSTAIPVADISVVGLDVSLAVSMAAPAANITARGLAATITQGIPQTATEWGKRRRLVIGTWKNPEVQQGSRLR